MLHTLPLAPDLRSACDCIVRVPSVANDPWQNYLLAALPLADRERLRPDLQSVALLPGWPVHGAGEREPYLYFPTSGIVSRFHVTAEGDSMEIALTGREGVIGVASFLGGGSTMSQAVVTSAGRAFRLKAAIVDDEFDRDSRLSHLLLRYTQALMVQIGQVAVCNRHHPLEQQLCRWILACLDRMSSNQLDMTQELIAEKLGVRRESVTQAAGKLQEAGLIQYSRGHITALDRPGLEARVCECYAVVRREYDRLLGAANCYRA